MNENEYIPLEDPDSGRVIKFHTSKFNEALKEGYIVPGTSVKQVESDLLRYEETKPRGKLESLKQGALEGASLGFRDELAGYGEAGNFGKKMERTISQGSQKQNPWSHNIGGVLGAIPASAGVGASLGAVGIPAMGLRSAMAAGSLQGLGESEDKSFGAAALGAGLGAVGYGTANAIGGIAKMFTPSELARTAENQAVKSTNAKLGQLRKLGENPENFGRDLLESGIIQPFKTSAGIEKLAAEKASKTGKIIGEYDRGFAQDAYGINRGRLSKDMSKLTKPYEKQVGYNPAAEDIIAGYNKVVPRYQEKLHNNPKITINEANEMKRLIDKLGAFDKPKADLTDLDRKVIQGVRGSIKGEANKSIGERYGQNVLQDWEGTNKGYSTATKALGITEDDSLRQLANRTVSPSDYITGAGAAAAGGPSVGILAGFTNFIGRNYGNSTIAVGADKLSKLLSSSPEKLQKFMGKLGPAIRDPSKFAITHAMLMTTQPEYKALIEGKE